MLAEVIPPTLTLQPLENISVCESSKDACSLLNFLGCLDHEGKVKVILTENFKGVNISYFALSSEKLVNQL